MVHDTGCVYYPLIYGLWNRTVRKEMKRLLCGDRYRDTIPTRVRSLSLTTHIQDLGMSPGLTAAIISGSESTANGRLPLHHHQRRRSAYNLAMQDQELPPTVSNKRRHTLHSLPAMTLTQTANGGSSVPFHSRLNGLHSWVSRDTFRGRHGIGVIAEECEKESSGDEIPRPNTTMRRWRNGYSFPTVTDFLERKKEHEATTPAPKSSKSIAAEKKKLKFGTATKVAPPQLVRCQSMKSRAREKPATGGLLELTSAEVLSNAALSPALLFAGSALSCTRTHDVYPMANGAIAERVCRVDIDDALTNLSTPEIVITASDDTMRSRTRSGDSSVISEPSAPQNLDIVHEDRPKSSWGGFHINFLHHHQSTSKYSDDHGNHITDNHATQLVTDTKPSLVETVEYGEQNKSYCDVTDGCDAISLLTGGRIHGSNLIHLEAGEPIKVRQWSQNEFVDFFASSVAYGVLEAGKSLVQDQGAEENT